MALTPFIFLGFFSVGLLATIFNHPRFGLYTYFLAFFMSPTDTWWGDLVPEMRYLLIAGSATLISLFIHGTKNDGLSFFSIGGIKIFIAFVVLLWPIYLWAVEPEEHLEGCILYTKHLLITYAIYRIAVDREMLKVILLVMVVGCLWFGFQAYGKSGTRLEGIAGAIADANTLGMHMSTGVLVAGLMFLGFQGRYKWGAFISIPLILNTVVLSGSRGAFLGLVSGGLAAALFCPKRYRGQFAIMSVLAVVLFFILAHEQFLNRLASILLIQEGTEAMDTSASGRFAIAAVGWKMAKDYPLGVGHKGTRSLSPRYMPEHMLSKGRRSAHSTIMAALVSYGFIGAMLYLAIYLWVAKQLFRLRRFAESSEDTDLGILISIFGSVFAIVFISGVFSNFVFAEVQFWMVGLLAATLNLPEVRENFGLNSRGRRGYVRNVSGPDRGSINQAE